MFSAKGLFPTQRFKVPLTDSLLSSSHVLCSGMVCCCPTNCPSPYLSPPTLKQLFDASPTVFMISYWLFVSLPKHTQFELRPVLLTFLSYFLSRGLINIYELIELHDLLSHREHVDGILKLWIESHFAIFITYNLWDYALFSPLHVTTWSSGGPQCVQFTCISSCSVSWVIGRMTSGCLIAFFTEKT